MRGTNGGAPARARSVKDEPAYGAAPGEANGQATAPAPASPATAHGSPPDLEPAGALLVKEDSRTTTPTPAPPRPTPLPPSRRTLPAEAGGGDDAEPPWELRGTPQPWPGSTVAVAVAVPVPHPVPAPAQLPAAVGILRRLAALAALALLAGSAVMLVSWQQRVATAERFLRDPCTLSPDPARCADVRPGVVAGIRLPGARGGVASVQLSTPQGSVEVDLVGPGAAAAALVPGAHVLVVEASGTPAQVVLPGDGIRPSGWRLLTTTSPAVDVDVPLAAAVLLGACGVACAVLVAPVPRRWRQWSLRRALTERRIRLLLYGFSVAQALDVLTSIAGRHNLLYERAALTRAAVEHWGDAGFAAAKAPALLATVLGIARLPARIAVPLLWLATVAMLVVVVGNLAAIAGH